jgi:glutathione S-transferase
MAVVGPTMAIQDEQERLAARKAQTAPDGALTQKVQVLETVLEGCKTPFYCGDKPTVADFRLYLWLSLVRSG